MKRQSAKGPLGRVVKSTEMPDLRLDFTPEQLAKAITAKRTGMKLKLIDVAEALNISKPTLVKIEKGDTNVKLALVLKVMEYLGLSFTIISDTTSSTTQADGVSDDGWF